MIVVLGWIATIIVLIGYFLNATQRYVLALITWLIGDAIWLVYDYFIDNWSHAALCTIIIVINIYGIIRRRKRVMSNRKITKLSEGLLS